MRRVPRFLAFLIITSVLAPALAGHRSRGFRADVKSQGHGCHTGSGRGFGLGAVALFQPVVAGTVSSTVPNILATWGTWAAIPYRRDVRLLSQRCLQLDLGVRGWYHVHAALRRTSPSVSDWRC